MKMFAILGVLAIVVIGAYIFKGPFRTPDLGQYYPPTLYHDSQYHSISIAVEIDKKRNKVSFVDLFNIYGFSGNGPSMEQVVKANLGTRNVEYDSEGDAFIVYAPNQETYVQVLKELEAVTRIESLNAWLRKAAWIPIKE